MKEIDKSSFRCGQLLSQPSLLLFRQVCMDGVQFRPALESVIPLNFSCLDTQLILV